MSPVEMIQAGLIGSTMYLALVWCFGTIRQSAQPRAMATTVVRINIAANRRLRIRELTGC